LDVSERIGAFSNFGFILTLLALASCSIRQLFAPSNFRRLLAVMAGFAAALYSGFRTSVIYVILAWLAAAIRDLRWMVLPLLPILIAGLFALSFINSEVVSLPKQMQRSLAFLPGKWNSEMVEDVEASNDFRASTWSLWRQQYFSAHPWFGRGFGFRSEWAKGPILLSGPTDYRQTVEVGDLHNGLFASLDAFGTIGTIFFAIWNIGLFVRIFRRADADQHSRALRFVGLCLAVYIMSYWGGALNLGTFLPQEFALAAVFLRLQRETSFRSAPVRRKIPRGELVPREVEATA
jgi:O-antigen ligase